MPTIAFFLIAVAVTGVAVWLLMRRWERSLVAGAARKLQLPISAFQLQRRRKVIDRVLSDESLQQRISEQAEATGRRVHDVHGQCRRYAEEIVPAFKAVFYFRIGYWLARSLLLSLYRVHARFVDAAALDAIEPGASVVLISNHRSNVDVLLLNFLASHRSTLMHTAGEWARMWPLYHFVRLAGNCVTDRDAQDVLYRAVFKTYIQMAVREHINIGVFPEGELPRDGRMCEPQFGLFSYAVTACPPPADRLYLLPVAINYDRVPEERQLVAQPDAVYRHRSKLKMLVAVIRAVLVFAGRVLSSRRAQFGNACASFGRPVLLSDWQAAEGVGAGTHEERREWVSKLGRQTVQQVAALVPVLPVHALAVTLVSAPDNTWSREAIEREGIRLMNALRDGGAIVCLPGEDASLAIAAAVDDLERRKTLSIDAAGRISARPGGMPLLQYMANSVSHLAERS